MVKLATISQKRSPVDAGGRALQRPVVWPMAALATLSLVTTVSSAQAPAQPTDTLAQQVAQLAAALDRQEAELAQSRSEILALRQQLAAIRSEAASVAAPLTADPANPSGAAAANLAQEVDALREQQEIEGTQLATHEQTKVDTASKYPLTLTGLILVNAFNNTGGVDQIAAPVLATGGGVGTTGISLQQTMLGLQARGPHLYGATTRADVSTDFFGGGTTATGSSGGYSVGGLLRLRTAHVDADWQHAHASLQLDRPILSPNVPTSLTAIAQPPLAWSGNLWNWVPQLAGGYNRPVGAASTLSVEAALVDVPDASTLYGATSGPSLGEQSRWPGSELRLGYAHGDPSSGFRIGAGGYFSPHEMKGVLHYDAWAGTLDYRVPFARRFEASGAFYRGTALGGLGGGAYKDAVYSTLLAGQYTYERPLDDVGGWAQLKARAGQRLQFNADYGLDNAFASELRPYVLPGSSIYATLVRNSTFFANAIYNPFAYTLFTVEYRRLDTTPATGSAFTSNVLGLAAGYKF